MDEKKLKKLEKPEVEVIQFEKEDVIATSTQKQTIVVSGPTEPVTEIEIP